MVDAPPLERILPRIIAKYSWLYSEYHWCCLHILRAINAQDNKRSDFPVAMETDMRVMVLGSGVIGTTSAYYLAQAGFEVVVVDRQNAVAMETSFANAGQVSPGYASPWAAPGVPLKAVKWMLQQHAPLAIRTTSDIDQYL